VIWPTAFAYLPCKKIFYRAEIGWKIPHENKNMAVEKNGNLNKEHSSDRRVFLSTGIMGCSLTASYGTLAVFAGQYLYLASPSDGTKAWRFVAKLKSLAVGDTVNYESPAGAKIVIARQADKGTVEDFVALSRVCPHLGCQVHWEQHNNRFFCPCHNGVFDPNGKPISGPPADAGQSLVQYPLRVEDGLLFIEVPVDGLRSPEKA
jgi:Rieske Fe-S protein